MLSSEDDQLDLAAKAPNKQERWQKEPRPNKFHEVGLKGRKTGIMAPTAVERDADGLMNVGDWFRDADEEITELARGISEEFPTTPVKDAPLQPNDTELSQKTSPSTPLPPSPSPAMKQRVSVRRVANNAISRLPRPSMFDLQLDSPLLSTPVTFNVTTNPFMSDKELLPSVSPTKKRSRRDTPADLELPASETIPTEDLDQIAFGRIPTEDLNQLPLEAIATEDIHLASETIQTEDLDLLVSETIQTKTSFSISGHGLDDDEKEITVNKKIPAKRASERSNGLESEPELRPEFESESDQQQELDDPIQNSEPSSEADEVLSIKPIKKPMKKPTKKGSVSRRENRASEDSLEPEPELHPEPESVPDQQHEPDDSSQDSESPSEMAEKRQRKLIKKQPLKKPTNKGSISRRVRAEKRASEDRLEPEPELRPEAESEPDQQQEPDDPSQDSEPPNEMAEKRNTKPIKKPLKKPAKKANVSKRARSENRASEESNSLAEPESELGQQQESDDHSQDSESPNEVVEKRNTKPIKKPLKKPAKKANVSKRARSEVPQDFYNPSSDSEDHDKSNGRRSKRVKMKPLKFWAGERVIVGRRESGFCPVPVIKEVIRIDSDEEAQDKPAPARAMRKSQKDIKPVVQPLVPVMNIVTGKEETQRIVATPDMLNPRLIQSGDYKFQKTFSEGDFIAAGVIVLPKGSEKPNKNSNSSALVFYVISGEVQVQVHKTIFVVKTGSQFFVPRGNQYLIQNQTNREAKLFFCHGREIVVAPSEDPTSTK